MDALPIREPLSHRRAWGSGTEIIGAGPIGRGGVLQRRTMIAPSEES
ncbi:hypothetical protein [Nonomuraea sp. NPDC050202]|jgi:hypothetical protein